ncbi:hypothetical protein MA9V2_245 [Chryseobacterium phage MA9V-2]|nr:hypothetical protein MA9V2_245 [Chryseobacterium phage MA9V-2]
MKNIELTKENALVSKVVEIAEYNNFSAFLVGSQLDDSKQSKDINIIGVMENQDFIDKFGFPYAEIFRRLMQSEYSDLRTIRYISISNRIKIELRFTTAMNVTFILMDVESFDYDLPYKQIH